MKSMNGRIKSANEIGLWKYNKATGYWNLARMCAQDTAQQWLDRFKRDDPKDHFVLSKRKPNKPPIEKALNSGVKAMDDEMIDATTDEVGIEDKEWASQE